MAPGNICQVSPTWREIRMRSLRNAAEESWWSLAAAAPPVLPSDAASEDRTIVLDEPGVTITLSVSDIAKTIEV